METDGVEIGDRLQDGILTLDMISNSRSYLMTSRLDALVACIAVAFLIVNKIIQRVQILQPPCVRDNPTAIWKWSNYVMSFAHATLSSTAALYTLYGEPDLSKDIYFFTSDSGQLTIAFSYGYFIYDIIDMMNVIKFPGTYQLIVHHITVLIIFSLPLYGKVYLGFCTVGLIVECSNIFLHFRELLLIAGVRNSNAVYRINSVINMGAAVVLRLGTLLWLTKNLLTINIVTPHIPYFAAIFGLTIGLYISVTLVVRIFNEDFAVSKANKCQ